MVNKRIATSSAKGINPAKTDLTSQNATPAPVETPARDQSFRPFSHYCARLYLLSLTHKQLKVGTANQRHPLYSSESSQHISRNKKKEHQWQNKEQ
jgi:hypothetical protein